MNSSRNILKKGPLTFILVVLWIFLSLFNCLTMPASLVDELSAQQEQNEDRSEESESFKLVLNASEAVQSSITFNLDFQSFLLSEIDHEEDENEDTPFAKQLIRTITKEVQVLLTSIISKNAP